jgi:uncharacterized protein (TIGR00730 family)
MRSFRDSTNDCAIQVTATETPSLAARVGYHEGMRVTVFGSARVTTDSPEYGDGIVLGHMLARRGDTVVSGGYSGVMEAVSRGAREAGGSVVGVTVAQWTGRITPNRYLSEEVSALTLFRRLETLIESDALIALPGGAGTLGEISLAWNLLQMRLMPAKPVIVIGPDWVALVEAFRQHLIIDDTDLALLTLVNTIDEAVGALDRLPQNSASWYG